MFIVYICSTAPECFDTTATVRVGRDKFVGKHQIYYLSTYNPRRAFSPKLKRILYAADFAEN